VSRISALIAVAALAVVVVVAPIAMAQGLHGPTGGSITGTDISVNKLTITGTGATGIDFTDSNGLNRISWGSGRYVNFNASGQFQLTGGTDKYLASANGGTCTLNGGSPATCTVTVSANARCNANTIGTTAASAKALAVNLATTTLTVTAANGSTEAVNIWCDR
jgi:hypothetical protein